MLEYKGHKIEKHSKYPAAKVIKPIGKGRVCLQLRGMYTNDQEAKLAIDGLPRVKAKRKQEDDSETGTTGGDK